MYIRNNAIADYLLQQGFTDSLDAFKREAEVVRDNVVDLIIYNIPHMQKTSGEARYNGLLEKKWTSVVRLQKKVTYAWRI